MIIITAGGLLAGNRNTDGSFNNLTSNTNFWSSVQSGGNAWNRNLNSGNATVNRNANDKAYGFSVRCLKDWLISSSLKLATRIWNLESGSWNILASSFKIPATRFKIPASNYG